MAGGLGLRSRPLRGLLYEPVTLKPVFSEEIAFYFLGRGGLAARLQQSPKTQCLGVLGAEALAEEGLAHREESNMINS